MTTPLMPAVVVSGHTMALAVIRSLGEAGVPVVSMHYDPRDFAQVSRYVVADVPVPSPMVDEAAFIDALAGHSRLFGRSILIPASDESLVALSRHRDRLAERYAIMACPPWEVTERVIDKSRTYELAIAAGVPVPRTSVPRSVSELHDQAVAIGFPVLLKPAESHRFYERFHRKMVVAEAPEDLEAAYQAAEDAGIAVTVQEIVPGDDDAVVNYNAYVRDGRPLVEFTARQLRKAPPRFGSPRVAVSEHIREVVTPGRRILEAVGFDGFACTEFKRDARDGRYRLMEVNGRHNLSGMLAIRCGVDFPLIQYRELVLGMAPGPVAYRAGVHWTDFFRDVGYTAANIRDEGIGPLALVAPYARSHCDAVFDRSDPAPFVCRARNLIAQARQALCGSKER